MLVLQTTPGALNVQYEDTESKPYMATALAYIRKLHDQGDAPERSLERVHGEESAGFQRIAKEEQDGENVDEEYYTAEEYNDNEQSTGCKLCVCAVDGVIYETEGWITSSNSFTLLSEMPTAPMIKSMIHMRTIQKGTRTRFCQNTGRCAMVNRAAGDYRCLSVARCNVCATKRGNQELNLSLQG